MCLRDTTQSVIWGGEVVYLCIFELLRVIRKIPLAVLYEDRQKSDTVIPKEGKVGVLHFVRFLKLKEEKKNEVSFVRTACLNQYAFVRHIKPITPSWNVTTDYSLSLGSPAASRWPLCLEGAGWGARCSSAAFPERRFQRQLPGRAARSLLRASLCRITSLLQCPPSLPLTDSVSHGNSFIKHLEKETLKKIIIN